jgi:3-dehydroquinate synthase
MKTLQVELGDRSYPIFIGNGLLKQKQLIQPYIKGRQVVVVTNETIAPLYLEQLMLLLTDYDCRTVILKDGEEYKNIDGIMPILDTMMTHHFDRRVTLIALGGGVIGDMTGFAAAIYRRGVNFIQIPTTLLAQVDSSVGGKTGVNHPLGKNMIGAFYQPQCVIADVDTLNTLEDQQLSAGLAEVIKYALIDDIQFLQWLEQHMPALLQRHADDLIYAIEKSCIDKARIVSMDEKESGVRALLNLGHTFGHAIETAAGYGQYLHGEAVAIGMVMAADLSKRHGWITAAEEERIKNIIKSANLPISIERTLAGETLRDLMSGDKKVLDGQLHLVLFRSLSNSFISNNFDHDKLTQTINEFC